MEGSYRVVVVLQELKGVVRSMSLEGVCVTVFSWYEVNVIAGVVLSC
jgi:hypothetical protein